MKVTIRREMSGNLSAYVPKKDLEEAVVDMQNDDIWGGWIELANGWRLELPMMAAETRLPITVEAKKLQDA